MFSSPGKETASGRPEIIILTGSIGAISSYLLESLLKAPKVEKIYRLDRAASAERQAGIHALRGLSTDFDTSKVEIFRADLTAPFFGLDESLFEKLSTTVARIVHCAWPVDFNFSLQSFMPQIQRPRSYRLRRLAQISEINFLHPIYRERRKLVGSRTRPRNIALRFLTSLVQKLCSVKVPCQSSFCWEAQAWSTFPSGCPVLLRVASISTPARIFGPFHDRTGLAPSGYTLHGSSRAHSATPGGIRKGLSRRESAELWLGNVASHRPRSGWCRNNDSCALW